VHPVADTLIQSIQKGFARSEYPGDAYLLGSVDGCEPYDEVGPFKGKTDWSVLEAEFLDEHYCALSFFSEAGFRFFLPAYLVADVRGLLQTADPAFHLTHGFSDDSYEERKGERVRVHRWGKSKLINPRRYGAATTYDYARYRLSVFAREEARAVVDFLSWKRVSDAANEKDIEAIDAALALFWLERAQSAPTAEALAMAVKADAELGRP
jgi:hypothetical protein